MRLGKVSLESLILTLRDERNVQRVLKYRLTARDIHFVASAVEAKAAPAFESGFCKRSILEQEAASGHKKDDFFLSVRLAT